MRHGGGVAAATLVGGGTRTSRAGLVIGAPTRNAPRASGAVVATALAVWRKAIATTPVSQPLVAIGLGTARTDRKGISCPLQNRSAARGSLTNGCLTAT